MKKLFYHFLPLPRKRYTREKWSKYTAQNVRKKSYTNWAMERGDVLNAIMTFYPIGYLCI